MSYRYLAQIYVNAGRPDLALEPARAAIAGFERLGDAQRDNLAAALGDLANAYGALGHFDAALEAAERGLALDRALGNDRNIASDLGRIAAILRDQQRTAEADARYAEALQAARAAGDAGLQGAILQHQGGLQMQQGRHARAVELYKQAIALLQQAGHAQGEMMTCDLLASAEMQQGRLDEAEAWYARSRELAAALGDRKHQAGVAQNVGILYQTRAEQATGPARAAWLRRAAASVEESLAIKVEREDQVGAASSYGQLGVLHRMLEELDKAEENMLKALSIHESLNLPVVYQDYGNLADIARDRGDAAAAAQWQAKRDAKLAELEKLRRGPVTQTSSLPPQVAQLILALAQAVYQSRVSGARLAPEAAEALAQLVELPMPLGGVGSFLQTIAEGADDVAVPPGLPPELDQICRSLVKALA